jgi:hypothetical protein
MLLAPLITARLSRIGVAPRPAPSTGRAFCSRMSAELTGAYFGRLSTRSTSAVSQYSSTSVRRPLSTRSHRRPRPVREHPAGERGRGSDRTSRGGAHRRRSQTRGRRCSRRAFAGGNRAGLARLRGTGPRTPLRPTHGVICATLLPCEGSGTRDRRCPVRSACGLRSERGSRLGELVTANDRDVRGCAREGALGAGRALQPAGRRHWRAW